MPLERSTQILRLQHSVFIICQRIETGGKELKYRKKLKLDKDLSLHARKNERQYNVNKHGIEVKGKVLYLCTL